MNLLTYDLDLGGGSLLQSANRSSEQMMSYIIDCPEGGTIVIDGGTYCEGDANHLYKELEKRGKKVDYWFFTHCHHDHYGAWLKLIEDGRFDITVSHLCFHFPPKEWLFEKEDPLSTKKFFAALKQKPFSVTTPRVGDCFSVGGVTVEVLNEPINYHSYRAINATSLIFKVHFPKRSVLFLGDFDAEAEEDYAKHFSVEKLKCDIVQMAHHGQNGVSRNFYQLIQPKFCLYTAPDWLWENNAYYRNEIASRGKGSFTIMETRLWMAELGVIRSFHLGDGDWLFR